MNPPLLSIAIPAYGRPIELEHALKIFVSQIVDKYEDEIEIVISDDCTPDDRLGFVRDYADRHSFIKYRRYQSNMGLERNLIACTEGCSGEYLWIFGDDDFLESEDALDQVMRLLREGDYDFYVLNRTRRSFDLSRLISANWMQIDQTKYYPFPGLREFCLQYGFISIIGFISVNIFRRRLFQQIDASKYLGTMYPQLGSMVEAFHDKKTLLIGRPLVCHRTQTAEEKRKALGGKAAESDFMADVKRRNAIYFSHPYIRMLAELVDKKAFDAHDIVKIPENTVINGLLIDFLLQTVALSQKLSVPVEPETWSVTKEFLYSLPLDRERRRQVDKIFVKVGNMHKAKLSDTTSLQTNSQLTITVVTPSYNQAEFLAECLSSVASQTYKPIEHLVFDPGSTDGSREIAADYPHVTLIAEPDTGQSDALNKGFARARGDIIAWLNSDDCYAHHKVFETVIQRFSKEDAPDIVYGKGIFTNESGDKLRDVYVNKDPSSLGWRLQQEDGILQPALFMRRSVIERVGPLRNDLHYCMDYEFWIRCVNAGMKFVFMDEDIAIARYHSSNKTYGMRENSYSEVCDMLKEHFGYVNHIWLKRYAEYLSEGHDGVLAHAGNSGLKDIVTHENIYRGLLRAYNGTHDTYRLLNQSAAKRGPGDTLREMKKLGITPTVPCKEIPVEQAQEPGHVAYTVGQRRWAYDSKWKSSEIAKAHEFLRDRIAKRRSDTCVIVGNGPSLNKTDLSLLNGQDVIVSNNVFLNKELLNYATYFTVVNYLVAEQSSQHINRLESIYKILPYWMAYCLNPGPNTYFVDAVGRAEFSKNMFENMSWRHTVTFFNLHLAYGLGYRKVVLIGFDHNYKQPQNVVEQDVIQSYEEDENHFHPNYFRGKKWQAADVDMMEEMYSLAKQAFEEDGRSIINSTVGGKLELFQRLPLWQALDLDEPPQAPSQSISLKADKTALVGPFERSEGAHCDETVIVARLFGAVLKGSTMIDVGAHHGTALAPFLDLDWNVFAFEPDNNNRTKLLEFLAKHRNGPHVTVDTRCVSNHSKKGVSFYRSDVSAGISGLSAFHESHVESQQVDTVSLADYFRDTTLPVIDFLKIDTEGHDLFVLQGFPWNRGKPTVIECEFEDAKSVPLGYTFRDLAQYLVEKGYTVYVSEWHPILRYGIRHDWCCLKRYPCVLNDDNAWGNLLAFLHDPGAGAVTAALRASIRVTKQLDRGPKKDESRIGMQEVNKSAPSPRQSQKRAPVSLTLSARIRRWARLRYGDFASAVKARSLVLFRIGQIAAWTARIIRNRPVATIGFLSGVALLAFLPFHQTFWPYRAYFWTATFVLGLTGAGVVFVAAAQRALHQLLEIMRAEVVSGTSMVRYEADRRTKTLEAKVKALTERVVAHVADANKAAKSHNQHVAERIVDLSGQLSALKQGMNELLDADVKRIDELQNKINEVSARSDKADKQLASVIAQLEQNAPFQRFNRILKPKHIDILRTEWGERLGIHITKPSLAYLAHRIRMAEQNSVGRLATQVEDAVLRTLVSSAVQEKSLEILEIGTLFGIGLVMLYEHNHGRYDKVHVTAIDPLDGYYGEKVPDMVLNIPVTRATFWRNMDVAGVPREDITLIDALSTTDNAIAAAKKRRYDVLIIDGDHSYAGVKADFQNYIGMMRRGGFIIFDDYNSNDWPDVKSFVDKEIMGREDLAFVGAEWRTAVFRVVNTMADAQDSVTSEKLDD